MTFQTTIARLREASYAPPAAGENPNTCRVDRQDLRTALHVIDRLDADLRQAGVLTLGTPPISRADMPELRDAAARLTKFAQEARVIYGQETCAGGEPEYPSWTDDVMAITALAVSHRSKDQ